MKPIDIPLYTHQRLAVEQLKNGSILCGGVGTGKSRTALVYYWEKVLRQKLQGPSLYIITTARKRDTMDWEKEAEPFPFPFKVDSWNNIAKYIDIHDAFFLFDEHRAIGSGKWAKSFIKIAKNNQWILLTATPGDTWMDYIPVFIAHGYYRNKTDFCNQHVVYSRYSKYPKIDRYEKTGILLKHRNDILVNMEFKKKTVPHKETIWVAYDREKSKLIWQTRWDPWKDEPFQNAGALCYALRRVSNDDIRRFMAVIDILRAHSKAIVFYNFDYELEGLRTLFARFDIPFSEWNGHNHESIPEGDRWAYLVQYTAGAEGWNCIETDTLIFYSANYSYKTMQQAAGRIDRLNTPYTDLYYYHLCSRSGIDMAIQKALKEKRNFNESMYVQGIDIVKEEKHAY